MRPQQPLSKEEWDEWRSHPTTKFFMAALRQMREDLKDAWAEGAFTDPSTAGNALAQGRAIGGAQILRDIVVLDEVSLNGVMFDEPDTSQQFGPPAEGESDLG